MRIEIEADDTPACHIAPELSIYRKTTVAFLRKYFRMSIELGHLPSLLGREFFRSHVTSYSTYTFEDAVIFTHDVERCLEGLPKKLQTVLARIVFQHYTQEETAELMDVSFRSVRRWYGEALDRIAEIFVRHGLLAPIKIAQTPWELTSEGNNVLNDERVAFDDADSADENENENPEQLSALPPKKPVMSTQGLSGRALDWSRSNCS